MWQQQQNNRHNNTAEPTSGQAGRVMRVRGKQQEHHDNDGNKNGNETAGGKTCRRAGRRARSGTGTAPPSKYSNGGTGWGPAGRTRCTKGGTPGTGSGAGQQRQPGRAGWRITGNTTSNNNARTTEDNNVGKCRGKATGQVNRGKVKVVHRTVIQ